MKNIKKFYKKNWLLISINFVLLFSIFFINIIQNSILIKEYNFDEKILSLSSSFLALGLFIGTFIIRWLYTYKRNYFKDIIFFSFFLFLINTSLFFYIEFEFFKHYYLELLMLLFRFLDGLFSSFLFFSINYLLSYKIINNDRKSIINSLLQTKNYIIKIVAPLIASFIITLLDYNNIIYIISSIFYITITLLVFNIKNKMIFKYYRYQIKRHKDLKPKYINKKITIKLIKEEIFNFSFLKKLYINNILFKKFLVFEIIIQNLIRPMYDYYLILFFIMIKNYSIIEGTFLITLMFLGQSITILNGLIIDYNLKTTKFHFIKTYLLFSFYIDTLLVIFYILFYFILFYFDNYYLIGFFLFLLGFLRNFYNINIQNSLYYFVRKEKKLESYKASLNIIGEVSHILGYMLFAILFFFFKYKILFLFIIILFILKLIINKIILKLEN